MSENNDDTSESEATVQTVRALLATSGLRPPDDEVERLARLYPGIRRNVERFHQVDVGDEVMAAVFRADPSGEIGR